VSEEGAAVTRGRRGRSTEKGPLDAQAWADAGLDALAANGIDGVRVEVLAKSLAVTKGSFYWHFKDRDAFLSTMLDRWRRRATLALIQRLDSGSQQPIDRLRELLRLPMQRERSARAAEIELAIRLWGRTDARARAALEEVDELRLDYLTQLLVGCGVPAQHARARAVLAYSYQRVAPTLIPADAAELMRACEDLLIGPVA